MSSREFGVNGRVNERAELVDDSAMLQHSDKTIYYGIYGIILCPDSTLLEPSDLSFPD